MKRAKYLWLLAAILLVAPHLLVYAAGFGMLAQWGCVWRWGLAAIGLTLAGWLLIRLLATSRQRLEFEVKPGQNWSPASCEAWGSVEEIAARTQQQNIPLDRPDEILAVLQEVFESVAHHYHPNVKQASLEIPLPHALLIAELVARDLRQAYSDRVPGAEVLTVNDFLRIHWLAGLGRRLSLIYRLASAGFNPLSQLLREFRTLAMGGITQASGGELKRLIVGFCVRKAGFYAIELYSGHLVLEGLTAEEYQTRRSQRDVEHEQTRAAPLSDEPLRVLVAGQVKSGKSSLINGLFGQLRAAVDVLPTTAGTEPYLLEREGIPQAIVLDTPGYETSHDNQQLIEQIMSEVIQSDLLLIVCSALSAARRSDRRLLDAVRAFYRGRPDRVMPTTVVVVSHIDQLRPLNQWQPPYDLARPEGAKANTIADAIQAVAEDLALGPEQVIVPACLKEGSRYNIEESLMPAIVERLPEVERAKCLRCLRTVQTEEYWRRLWGQSLHSGRVLLQQAIDWTVGRKPEQQG